MSSWPLADWREYSSPSIVLTYSASILSGHWSSRTFLQIKKKESCDLACRSVDCDPGARDAGATPSHVIVLPLASVLWNMPTTFKVPVRRNRFESQVAYGQVAHHIQPYIPSRYGYSHAIFNQPTPTDASTPRAHLRTWIHIARYHPARGLAHSLFRELDYFLGYRTCYCTRNNDLCLII